MAGTIIDRLHSAPVGGNQGGGEGRGQSGGQGGGGEKR